MTTTPRRPKHGESGRAAVRGTAGISVRPQSDRSSATKLYTVALEPPSKYYPTDGRLAQKQIEEGSSAAIGDIVLASQLEAVGHRDVRSPKLAVRPVMPPPDRASARRKVLQQLQPELDTPRPPASRYRVIGASPRLYNPEPAHRVQSARVRRSPRLGGEPTTEDQQFAEKFFVRNLRLKEQSRESAKRRHEEPPCALRDKKVDPETSEGIVEKLGGQDVVRRRTEEAKVMNQLETKLRRQHCRGRQPSNKLAQSVTNRLYGEDTKRIQRENAQMTEYLRRPLTARMPKPPRF